MLKDKRPKLSMHDEFIAHFAIPLFSIVSPLIFALFYSFFTGKTKGESLDAVIFCGFMVPVVLTFVSIFSFYSGFLVLNKMERVMYKQIKLAVKNGKFLVQTLSHSEKFVVFESPKGLIGVSVKDNKTKVMLTNVKDDSVVDISGHFVNMENFTMKMKYLFNKVEKLNQDKINKEKREAMIDEDSEQSLKKFLNSSTNSKNS